MNIIRFLLEKEFLQIFRNRAMLPIIFVMPVIQLIVLSFAASYELKLVEFVVVDQDFSDASRRLVSDFEASGYFRVAEVVPTVEEGVDALLGNRAKMVLSIPVHFGRDLHANEPGQVQILIDAVDGATAGLVQGYSRAIIGQFSAGYRTVYSPPPPRIEVSSRNWYNPELNYLDYMVPGILVVLVTMIGVFLSGMNIVREREIGTIEQLNVTPIRKHQFIIGKLLPFWIIGLAELGVGLVIAFWLLQIPLEGSILLLFGVAGLYLLVVQGLGLFISTISHTQQQAMFVSWFILVIFILMGGLFTPIESMPEWAQELTLVNPIAHFIVIMRAVMLKGAGPLDIAPQVLALLLMGTVILTASVLRYRKTAA